MLIKKIWANLGVQDTKRTEKFYTALGFKLNGSPTQELASFLFDENNFVIHFFRRDKLKFGIKDNVSNAVNVDEVMFSLSAKTTEEVDTWAESANKAGGSIIKQAGRQEDGFYYCVFADPDGHKFNVLFIEEGM